MKTVRRASYISCAGCLFICLLFFACSLWGTALGIIPNAGATQRAETSTAILIKNMTATIIALTPTDTPTITPSPTKTLTPTRTPTLTRTPIATDTLTPSNTPDVTDTPAPSNTPMATNTRVAIQAPPTTAATVITPANEINEASGTRYVSGTNTLNVRTGPATTYPALGSLAGGTAVTITGEASGWYRIAYNGGEGWIAGMYTSANPPAVQQPIQQPSSNSGVQSQPTAQPAPGAVCECSGDLYNCASFDSSRSARACFDYCMATVGGDVHRLDADGDGLMCESRD